MKKAKKPVTVDVAVQETILWVKSVLAENSGEISKAVREQVGDRLSNTPCLAACDKLLGFDIPQFASQVVLVLGGCRALQERLTVEFRGRDGGTETLLQADAYRIVDLWGRLLGIESLLISQLQVLERAREDGVGIGVVVARFAAVYQQLEAIIAELGSQFAVLGTGAEHVGLLDSLSKELRSDERKAIDAGQRTFLAEMPV